MPFLHIAFFAMPLCVLPFSVNASLCIAFLRYAFLRVASLRAGSLRDYFLRIASLHTASKPKWYSNETFHLVHLVRGLFCTLGVL